MILHVALLAIALAFLPIEPGSRWRPGVAGAIEHPQLKILAMLAAVFGLPYFLLSTTAPLVQSLAGAARRSNPYRLFALSNAGALIALISYPLLDRAAGSRCMLRRFELWSIAFRSVRVLLCGEHARFYLGSRARASRERDRASSTERLEWIGLAAAGSMLLLATTNQLTENVAPVPLLWVVPLAIYLITFILSFESTRWYSRPVMLRLLAVAVCSVAYLISDINLSDAIGISLPIFGAMLFIGCMFCHGELNLLKPDAARLTTFYLMIALGGAIGAIFVGLVAPLIFSGVYELPVALCAVAGLALWRMWVHGWSQRLLWVGSHDRDHGRRGSAGGRMPSRRCCIVARFLRVAAEWWIAMACGWCFMARWNTERSFSTIAERSRPLITATRRALDVSSIRLRSQSESA